MRTYVLRRLLHAIPLLLGVITISWGLMQLVPGDFSNFLPDHPGITQDTVDDFRRRFGLDRPWWVQYLLYLRNVLFHFDLGMSFSYARPAFSVLREGFASTLLLQGAAVLVTWGLAIPLGILAAVHRASWGDRAASLVAVVGLSIPEVVMGLLCLLFAARTGLFPLGGMHSFEWERYATSHRVLDLLWHLTLPAVVVSLAPLAARMRQTRGNLLDVLGAEYVTTARAKGLDERAVIYKHALRNALNPLITLFGYSLGALFSGSLIAEIIFSWPGLGRITFEALWTQDQYLVSGGILMVSVMLVIGNLVADLLLAAADPRVALD
jgi:peptide/nickel transport system permease protein